MKTALLTALLACRLFPQGPIMPGPGIAFGGAAPTGIVKIADVVASSSAGNTVVTSAIDTTGANLLVVGVGNLAGGTGTLTDSKGNTWTALTTYATSGAGQATIYYAKNATVGSGHTFTFTTTSTYPSIFVAAFSGANTTSPFDVQNGNAGGGSCNATGSGGVTCATGNITPAVNNEVWVSLVQFTSNGNTASPTNGTLINSAMGGGGASFAGALSYKVQTTAATVQETWSVAGSSLTASVAIAAFKQ
jgi:hypothetical protein